MTLAVVSETTASLEEQGIEILSIPVAERIWGFNAVACLAYHQGQRLYLKPAVERALILSGHTILVEKATTCTKTFRTLKMN